MDESGGFFKVYRKAQQSAFWTKKPYVNYRGVWLTMLMMTNWKEGFFDGHTIKVGQFATSIESLSRACGLSIKQVRNVINTMKEIGMITVENVANRFSLVTICNWAIYNGEESRKGQTEGKLGADRGQTEGKLGADRGQTEGKLGATIEEGKKLRIEEWKKNTSCASDLFADAQSPQQKKQKIIFDGQFIKGYSQEDLDALSKAYPAITVTTEIMKASAWLVANPKNVKKNVARFVNNWLSRAQDRAPSQSDRSRPSVFEHPDVKRGIEKFASGKVVEIEDGIQEMLK